MNEIKLINGATPPEAEPHITAEDEAMIYQSILGEKDGVLSLGQNLKAETISANKVRIHNGAISIGGHIAIISPGEHVDVALENGPKPGLNRIDLIMAKFTKAAEGEGDKLTIEVIKGREGPVANEPLWTQGNLSQGDPYRYFELYTVYFNGINIVNISKKWQPLLSLAEVDDKYVKKEDSGWIDQQVGDGRNDAQILARYMNGMVFVKGTCTGGGFPAPHGSSKLATTLEKEFSPDVQVPTISDMGTRIQVTVDTNGQVRIYGIDGESDYWTFFVGYPAKKL